MEQLGGRRGSFFDGRTLVWGLVIISAFSLLGYLLGRSTSHKTTGLRSPAEARHHPETLREVIISLGASEAPSLSEEAGTLLADLWKVEDSIETEAYRRLGSLGETKIFRQVSWWMSPEAVLKSEAGQPDSRLLAEASLSGRDLSMPPPLIYQLDGGETKSGLLFYGFGRVTKGLNSIVISYFSRPADSPEEIDHLWREMKESFGPEPAESRPPGAEYGFWYDEWRAGTRRVSVAKVSHDLPGRSLTQISVLYTLPGYGGAKYPLELLKVSFDAFRLAQARK